MARSLIGVRARLGTLALVIGLGAGAFVLAPGSAAVEPAVTCPTGQLCGTLVIDGSGQGTGTVTGYGINCTITNFVESGDCSQFYTFASSLTVSLTFTPWIGSRYYSAISGPIEEGHTASEPASIPKDGSTLTYPAFFVLAPRTLNLAIAGSGNGYIDDVAADDACPTRCTIVFDYGKTVMLEAHHYQSTSFVGWSAGPCAGQDWTCTFVIYDNITVTATFAFSPPTTASPPATATPRPTRTPGPTTATPTPGATPTGAAGSPSSGPSPASSGPDGASASPGPTGESGSPTPSAGPTTVASAAPVVAPASTSVDSGLILLLVGAALVVGVGGGFALAWSRSRGAPKG